MIHQDEIPIQTQNHHLQNDSLPQSTVFTIIFFGAIFFTTICILIHIISVGDLKEIKRTLSVIQQHAQLSTRHKQRHNIHHIESKHSSEHGFIYIYILLHHLAILGMIMMTIYITEYYPVFQALERLDFDQDSFLFYILLVIFAASFVSIKNNTTSDDTDHHTFNNIQKDDDSSFSSPLVHYGAKSVSSFKANDNDDELSWNSRKEIVNGIHQKNRLSHDGIHSILNEDIDAGIDLDHDGKSETDRILDDIVLDDYDTSTNKLFRTHEHSSRYEVKPLDIPSIHRNNDILNLNQTLEWKGFMTVCLLLYQYTNAGSYQSSIDNANIYYNIACIFITSYVFLSGFSHTMYFLDTGDFSIQRFIQIILRINMSALFISTTVSKSYIFYYACAIHSYAFIGIYITMKCKKDLNHTKYGLRLKVVLLAIITYLIWDLDSSISNILGTSTKSQNTYGEWYYRLYSHHWSSIIGIIFAVNFPSSSLFIRKLEAIGNPIEYMCKCVMGCILLGVMMVWVNGPIHISKYHYNSIHPYFGFLPVLCFIYFRNLHLNFRLKHISFFKQVGCLSLEIYLLHHHTFLCGNNGARVVFLPGYPMCNFILSTIYVVYLAKVLKTTTDVIFTLIATKNRDIIVLKTGLFLIILVTLSYFIAFVLKSRNLVSYGVVIICSVMSGILLYISIMDTSWNNYRMHRQKNGDDNGKKSTSYNRIVSSSLALRVGISMLGLSAVLLFSLGTYIILGNFGGFIPANAFNSPLPFSCSQYVNLGKWIPLDTCTEYQQGVLLREHNVGHSNKDCAHMMTDKDGPSLPMQWGWLQQNNETKTAECNFRYVSQIEARSKLKYRKIIFIGDTTTRNIFHALSRTLGDETAGHFNTTVSFHSDVTKRIDNTILEFRWSLLTIEILSKLKATMSLSRQINLIVCGGGLLDDVNLAEGKDYQRSVIVRLVEEMKQAKIPIVWINPTSVNTRALNNQEKQIHMSEEKVAEVRSLYDEAGVYEAASFVLDGPSFTKDRILDSYDGFHYPSRVYDVGAQILLNAFDWLLPESNNMSADDDDFIPRLGGMANPILGIIVLLFVLIGVCFYDAYFGISYLISILIRPFMFPRRMLLINTSQSFLEKYSLIPQDLHYEALQSMPNSSTQNESSEERKSG